MHHAVLGPMFMIAWRWHGMACDDTDQTEGQPGWVGVMSVSAERDAMMIQGDVNK